MNRTVVRTLGATAFAAAVLALSAPVLAGGHYITREGGGADRSSNRGGERSSQSSAPRPSPSVSSSSGRSSGPRFSTGGNGRNVDSGSMSSGDRGARYGNGQMRQGDGNRNGSRNGSGRFVEGAERTGNSRWRPPASGNFVMGNAPSNAPTESNRSNGSFQRAPGAITRGNFASQDRNSFSDRHYGTPRVPGFPASGGRYTNFPGHSPGHGHRSGRVWYGSRPYWGWNGGYYRGVYWPRAYYRPGFIGFVTLLPPVYSTYWYSGVSYYYANDLYYTWNPDRYGYVVTNPPPVSEDSSGSYSTSPDVEDDQGGSGPGDLYVYPRNGQSEEQTAQDRYECHQWAVKQTGFDPTLGETQSSSAGSSDDYRRAIVACLDGRGYSAN